MRVSLWSVACAGHVLAVCRPCAGCVLAGWSLVTQHSPAPCSWYNGNAARIRPYHLPPVF